MPPSRMCWPNAPRWSPGTALPAGEFYLRELPPLRAVLNDLSELDLLVVDGYADLDPGGRPAWVHMRTPSSASQ